MYQNTSHTGMHPSKIAEIMFAHVKTWYGDDVPRTDKSAYEELLEHVECMNISMEGLTLELKLEYVTMVKQYNMTIMVEDCRLPGIIRQGRCFCKPIPNLQPANE